MQKDQVPGLLPDEDHQHISLLTQEHLLWCRWLQGSCVGLLEWRCPSRREEGLILFSKFDWNRGSHLFHWGVRISSVKQRTACCILIYDLWTATEVVDQGRISARLLDDAVDQCGLHLKKKKSTERKGRWFFTQAKGWLGNSDLLPQVLPWWFKWNNLNLMEKSWFLVLQRCGGESPVCLNPRL